jgi:hypothetical protein
MEEEISTLEMRMDEIWDLLQDPTLPPLDREEFLRELDEIDARLMVIAQDDMSTLESVESESIGPDEYDREYLIVYGGFDLADEI